MSSIVIISIALAISLIFNGLMYWYSRQLTTKLAFIYDNIGDVSEIIANYRAHLKSVYSMEMFYGDETLKFLIDHTVSIGNILEDYEDPEFFLEEFEEEDVPQQEENTNAETPEPQQKDVFYAGTRRRDS
tara:strand:+ start:16627 stop:17016 length:390 start_codon:yes stop_codon:yes gene_type:complete